MRPVRLAAAIALAVLLALPVAHAAPGTGTLEATGVHVPGEATFEAASLSFAREGPGAPTLDLAATQVKVQRLGVTDRGVLYLAPTNERASHGASTLRLAQGAGGLAAISSTGPTSGTLRDVATRPAGGVALATMGDVTGCEWPECVGADGLTELTAATGQAALSGELRMMLRGVTLVVEDAGGRTTYASDPRDAPTGREDVWLLVEVEGATGTLAADGARWYAPEPTLRAAQASVAGATGRLDVGVRAYRANGEPVDLTGDLALAFAPVEALGVKTQARYLDAAPVAVSGDVASVSLRAVPILESSPAAAAGFAATLLALAGGVAYAWQHLAFHAAAFYTRLRQPDLLDNDARNRIYEIIRGNPGISARAVHRMSDQSWGTVVYHLRQLEKHHLVVSRSVGRTRNYYENHGKYRGMEVQLACLQSDRARTLARFVLQDPGVTQEVLAERSGFPQPTTSYYVRKLKEAGLVEERREGRYARYHPVGDVARFLELAEMGAQPPAAVEPGPAQA